MNYERLIRKFQVSRFVRRMLCVDRPSGDPHIFAAPFIGPLRVGPRVHLCRHG